MRGRLVGAGIPGRPGILASDGCCNAHPVQESPASRGIRPEPRRTAMDLDLSDSELAFQAEARAWLAAHVPAEPLPSMDTAEGWARHQEWERTLADARWSVVSWPREYHGREASLVEWVIFEEEYYRA